MQQATAWKTEKFECPHCHAVSVFDCVFSMRGFFDNRFYPVSVWACHHCDRAVFITHQTGDYHTTANNFGLVSIYPSATISVNSLVPAGIASDFLEASNDYNIGSFRSSAVMARRTIQKMCLNLGAKKGDKLYKQIEDLKTSGKLHPDLADMATEIRFLGNDGAHPEDDGLDDVSKEDAKEVLDFTAELLDDLYVRPQKVAAMKSKRSTRDATQTP
jgi:hypothetical protein